MPDKPKPISDKQLAANRANARKHGFCAEAFTVVRAEDPEAVAELIRNAMAVYQPLNSQEQDAVERIALSQHSIQRLFRMEAALFTSLFDNGVTTRRAVEEFDRLKSLRAELVQDLPEDLPDILPNEPISDPQPAQTEILPPPPSEPAAEPETVLAPRRPTGSTPDPRPPDS